MQDVDGFDKRDYPLHSAAIAEWEGFVFVNVAAEPEPFAEVFAPMLGRLTRFGLGAADGRPRRRRTRWRRTGSSSSRTTPSACTAR